MYINKKSRTQIARNHDIAHFTRIVTQISLREMKYNSDRTPKHVYQQTMYLSVSPLHCRRDDINHEDTQ